MTALVQVLLVALVRLFVGVRALSPAELPPPPFVLFANHASHFDTLVLWAALDAERRAMLRPVAAADYWGKTRLHRWVAEQVLGALLIARKREDRTDDPVASMLTVLDAGKAILIFPEGTRSLDGRIAPFKAGLFQLATQRPQVPLVPVYLQNPGRILPKGEILPVPFLCSIRVGEPLSRESEETKDAFVARARQAVITLS